jgi:SAM-dependent methyltransferase
MKLCPQCQQEYDRSSRDCPFCSHAPAIIDGFPAYAPELAYESSGFKADYFSELFKLESGNFWFRARNQLILWALKTYAPHFENLLEVGCGTGFVLHGISGSFPDAKLMGSEVFVDGLSCAARRLPTADLVQMDARKIPFVAEFDVVCAFDVIEHIKQDQLVLEQMHKSLKPGGLLVLTVPQHRWLWSAIDEIACHERRYSRSELEQKVGLAGFSVMRSTSFISALLPLMLLSRMTKKTVPKDFDHRAELRMNPTLNLVLEQILALERSGIKAGVNYPVGGSRLLIARKMAPA